MVTQEVNQKIVDSMKPGQVEPQQIVEVIVKELHGTQQSHHSNSELEERKKLLSLQISDFFRPITPKQIANWMINNMIGKQNSFIDNDDEGEPEDFKERYRKVSPENLVTLLRFVNGRFINNKIAKTVVFPEMVKTGKDPTTIILEQNLIQDDDTDSIQEFVKQVIETNSKSVVEYRKGKTNSINFLVGQVMKLSQGKVDPQLVLEELKKQLG